METSACVYLENSYREKRSLVGQRGLYLVRNPLSTMILGLLRIFSPGMLLTTTVRINIGMLFAIAYMRIFNFFGGGDVAFHQESGCKQFWRHI